MFKILVTVLFLLFLYHVREVFPPFIMGAITAYILYPAVKKLQKWGFAPIFSVFVIYIAAAAFTLYIMFHFWPLIVYQAESLFSQRKEIVMNLMQQVSQQFGWSWDANQMSDVLIAQLQNAIGKPEDIVHFGSLISKSLLGMLVCAVTSVYLLVDSKRVGRFFMRFVPVEKRNTVVSLATQMDRMFRKYIYGQIGLISLMSVVAFLIFSSFHLKYALLIALITGFLEIIPVLGPMLAILICTAFAVAQLGIANAVGVPLCLWVARLVEDYVIVPNTIGHAVELHPLAVIFAVIVGETMAGALGMLIAIPVAASVKVIIDFCYPPTTPPTQHEPKKNPLEWLIKAFNSPQKSSTEETMEDKAKADMLAIDNMHEVSSSQHQRLSMTHPEDEGQQVQQPAESNKASETLTATPAPAVSAKAPAATNSPKQSGTQPIGAAPAKENTASEKAGTTSASTKSTPASSAADMKQFERTTAESVSTADAKPSAAKDLQPAAKASAAKVSEQSAQPSEPKVAEPSAKASDAKASEPAAQAEKRIEKPAQTDGSNKKEEPNQAAAKETSKDGRTASGDKK